MFGRWAGDRIAIVGDYYSETVADLTWAEDLWTRVSGWRDGWVDISEHVVRSIAAFFGTQRAPATTDGPLPRSTLHPDGSVTAVDAPWWWDEEESMPESDTSLRDGAGCDGFPDATE